MNPAKPHIFTVESRQRIIHADPCFLTVESTAILPDRPDRIEARIRASADEYAKVGYCLVRDLIPVSAIESLLANYLTLVEGVSGKSFSDAHSPELAAFFQAHPDVESEVYLRIRDTSWLSGFARQRSLVQVVSGILQGDIALFSKIPFRIDIPMWTKELALWHQDYYYVRGSTDMLTAWIPFQDTSYLNGCLSVMPGSHLLGPIEHDLQIGKKQVPSGIFGREIRMVEVRRGDCVLFNSLLLHTGNLNLSTSIRYSLQPRYVRQDVEGDPGMGRLMAL